MPFFAGDIFISDVYRKPVLDQTGEEIGKLKDITVGLGDPFPAVTTLVVVSGKQTYLISWDQVNLFNKRVISVNVLRKDLQPSEPAPRTSSSAVTFWTSRSWTSTAPSLCASTTSGWAT